VQRTPPSGSPEHSKPQHTPRGAHQASEHQRRHSPPTRLASGVRRRPLGVPSAPAVDTSDAQALGAADQGRRLHAPRRSQYASVNASNRAPEASRACSGPGHPPRNRASAEVCRLTSRVGGSTRGGSACPLRQLSSSDSRGLGATAAGVVIHRCRLHVCAADVLCGARRVFLGRGALALGPSLRACGSGAPRAASETTGSLGKRAQATGVDGVGSRRGVTAPAPGAGSGSREPPGGSVGEADRR